MTWAYVFDIFSFYRRYICSFLSLLVFFQSAKQRNRYALRFTGAILIFLAAYTAIYFIQEAVPDDVMNANWLIFNLSEFFSLICFAGMMFIPIIYCKTTVCEFLTRAVANQCVNLLMSVVTLALTVPLNALYSVIPIDASVSENIAILIISIVLDTLIWVFFTRKWKPGDKCMIVRQSVSVICYVVMLLIIFWTNISAYSIMYGFEIYATEGVGSYLNYYGFIILAFICIFILILLYVIQATNTQKSKKEVLEQVIHEREQQYAIAKENVDIINRKCHDLKHQIQALKSISDEERDTYISGLEESIMIYGAVANTGNEVLDTVLSEKSLRCESRGIKFTATIDSASLHILQPIDLCTLFGNALDNAIEASEKVEDPEYKIISLNIYDKASMLCISLTNYSFIAPDFSGAGIKTSKQDKAYHGYGVNSIKEIASRYGGTTQITYEDNTFTLFIAIPIPDGKAGD